MKRALMMLPVLALAFSFGMTAEAKPNRSAMKAFEKECKQENPSMKKKDLKKCAKAKAKASV